MILLDTHALLWWALDPEQLSPEATRRTRQMEERGGFASAISTWELGVKVQRGKLDLGIEVAELVRRIERTGAVQWVPVDAKIWLQSLALDWDHRDPADRVIVASALLRGVPILTKDGALHRYQPDLCLW